MLLKKIQRIIKKPEIVLSYPILFWQRVQIRQVEKDGQKFYVFKGVLYPAYLNQGNAASTIVDKAKQYCQGRGIDIGADAWPFPGATSVQDAKDQNAYTLDKFVDGSLDYVFSSHCLEHLARWPEALKLWIRKLKPRGILFLYLPHESMQLWRPGGAWAGWGHKWSPTHEVLREFLTQQGMEIVEFNPGKDSYWSFHVVARKGA